jgi:tRNA-modifying protein YgfZ
MEFATKPSFSTYRPATWLRITGADAATFLQGQFTNDLRSSAENNGIYGLWLNQKGKVVADSFILRGPSADEFWVGSYFSPAAVVRERLEAYVIADDVVIEDLTQEWAGITLIGVGSGLTLKDFPSHGFIFSGRRTRDEHVEWLVPVAELENVRTLVATRGATEIPPDALELLRIKAGIPAVPRDIGPGELPNEGGLDAAAISYTKGCYLGQEVMARLKSMGQVRRRLMRVKGEGKALPALPAALFVGARKVGELRSALLDEQGNLLGLALLSLMHVTSEATLAFGPEETSTLRLMENP